jgi:hypothetical protein
MGSFCVVGIEKQQQICRDGHAATRHSKLEEVGGGRAAGFGFGAGY